MACLFLIRFCELDYTLSFPVLVQVDLLPKQQQPQSSTINLTELWKEP